MRGRPAVQAAWRWLGGICQAGSLRVRRLAARSSLRRAASRAASAPTPAVVHPDLVVSDVKFYDLVARISLVTRSSVARVVRRH